MSDRIFRYLGAAVAGALVVIGLTALWKLFLLVLSL